MTKVIDKTENRVKIAGTLNDEKKQDYVMEGIMEKLKDFLHRKDIEISVKRYGLMLLVQWRRDCSVPF